MTGNAIFDTLAEERAAAAMGHTDLVHLSLRTPIYEREQLIDHVYFPIDCVLSLVTQMRAGDEIEIGTIGREGTSGLPILVGEGRAANPTYCQVSGLALKMPASMFRELIARDVDFAQRLSKYLQAYVNMLGQAAACNRLHGIFERCSRWLLQTHDRVGSEQIPLTHEFLAMMLGSGRSGVTIALATLKQAGFIKLGHGAITILDRAGLEGVSCECYEAIRGYFAS